MRKIISILFLVHSILIFSQNKEITILDQTTKSSIDNVQIFQNGELIGKSNKNGVFINNLETGEIQFVKEGYIDISINIQKLNKIIYLQQIEEVIIQEVIIKPLKTTQIFDSIYSTIKKKSIYEFPNYFHVFNLLKTKNDTLHFINDRLLFKINNGFFINKTNNILKKFREYNFGNDGYELIYTTNNKNAVISNGTALGYFKIDQYKEFTILFENIKNYNLSIIKDDEFSKLIFTPKNKKLKFYYEGFIIFNNDDFGIVEFNRNIINNKNNIINTFFFKEKIQQKYLILNENYNIKYKKTENSYTFVSANSSYSYVQKKGNLKNYIFKNTCSTEATSAFDLINLKKINIINLSLK